MYRILIIAVFLTLLFFCSYRSNAYYSNPLIIPIDTLKRDTLVLDTVAITGVGLSAEAIFREKQKEHRSIYLWGDNKKPIQINPFGGIIININKVYSHFSRIGKQSRRLQKVFNQELEHDLINEIWKPYTVKYTELKGDSLFVFQSYFQPEYKVFKKFTHYEKLAYITKSMRLYRDSTAQIHDFFRLPKVEFK